MGSLLAAVTHIYSGFELGDDKHFQKKAKQRALNLSLPWAWSPFANSNWHNTKAGWKLQNLYGFTSSISLCSVPGSWPQLPERGGAPCSHSCCPEQAHRSHLPSGAERGRHWPAVRAVSELWSSALALSKFYPKKTHTCSKFREN